MHLQATAHLGGADVSALGLAARVASVLELRSFFPQLASLFDSLPPIAHRGNLRSTIKSTSGIVHLT